MAMGKRTKMTGCEGTRGEVHLRQTCVYCLLPTAYRLLVHCLLPTAYCLLLTASAAFPQPALPAALRNVGIEQRLNAQVPPDLVFRDENGRSVKLGDYFGSKPIILALVYYDCPMLCTQVLNGLVGSLKALSFDAGEQFLVLTVSFDPRETPELAAGKKESYLARYSRSGAAAGWHFLTGAESSIEALTHAVGFRYRYDVEKGQYAHASGIMVLTPQGKISRYFYGIEYSPRDLRLGLVEASNNRIGSPVDQLLLFCYHYDPATGKYGAVVMNFVRLGGAATVLTLGAILFLFLRRDARHGRDPKSQSNREPD
jgi:protein SCO1